MRPSLAVLGTVLWLPPCLGCPPEAPPPPEPVDATPDDAPWPHDPGAVWPVGCFVEVTASHPSQPWLALACTNAEANMGAVLVVDLDSGTLRSSTLIEDYVGWPATDVLRWHPDGELLATNVGTNGIAVLANGEVLGMAFPDETRDHPVAFVWVGDHVFTDTGAYFRIEEGQEPRFEFDELPGPRFQTLAWSETLGAVVGRVGGGGLAAYDPRREVTLWTQDFAQHPQGSTDCRRDGRRCVRRLFGSLGAPDALIFVDGDAGTLLERRSAAGPNIGHLRWGPDGLLVTSHRHVVGGPSEDRSVEAFRDGVSAWSTPLGARVVRASGVADASGTTWSPDGTGVALLLDRQEVQLLDGRDGALGIRFLALAKPIPEGLPDWYTPQSALPGAVMWPTADRIVRIAPHFLTIYDTGGVKVGELTMPAR